VHHIVVQPIFRANGLYQRTAGANNSEGSSPQSRLAGRSSLSSPRPILKLMIMAKECRWHTFALSIRDYVLVMRVTTLSDLGEQFTSSMNLLTASASLLSVIQKPGTN
jgi:hypothetical protein